MFESGPDALALLRLAKNLRNPFSKRILHNQMFALDFPP